MQNFRALEAPPPDPRASGGWGLCPQTPSLRRLGASPPDPHWPPAAGGSAPKPPKQPPPLRISGYAPGQLDNNCHKIKAKLIGMKTGAMVNENPSLLSTSQQEKARQSKEVV